MKKSFMTRILATGLSFAMAFSMAAVTSVTPASAASKPVLVDAVTGGSGRAVTVNVGEVAKLKVNAATKKTYAVSSVKKSSKKINTAVNKAGTVVYVRGVAETGEKDSAIRVSFKVKKTGKTSKFTFASKVKVVAKEPEVVALAISDVKQTASNAFNVTFNKDASKDVTKDNLTVKTTDGTTELSVKSVEFSADGLSAAVTVFGTLVDAKEYAVATGDASKTFTASVGEVASVVIKTASAEMNTATKIDFELRDANGIDVTPSVALDTHCIVSVEGSYSTAEIARASEAKITMTKVGDVAKVTITYNANKTGATDVVGTQDITCVAATAKVGSVLFAQTNDTNSDNLCAKFYQGLSSTEVKVGNNGGTGTVYFCATKDGEVISYDSYTVESANDNVASATTDSIGKYAKIIVTGNNVGTTQLNITASKNGVESFYTIPVKVTTVGVAASMTASGDKSEMSNATDSSYRLNITAQLKDSDNQNVAGTYIIERTSTAGKGVIFESGETSSDGKFKIDVSKVEGLSTNSWTRITFKVTGADNVTGKQFSKSVVVDVKALPAVLTNIDYKIEINKETIDQKDYNYSGTDTSKVTTVTTKLYATSNGLFAGYVGDTQSKTVSSGGVTAKLSGKTVESKSAIEVITGCALFGNEKFDSGDVINAGDSEETLTTTDESKMDFETVTTGTGGKVYTATATKGGITTLSRTVAKAGTYTVKYTLLINGKVRSLTKTFVVKNSYVTPTVRITSNKVDDINDTDDIIKKNMVSNVDMNDNESNDTSIAGIYKKVGSLYEEVTDATNNRVIIQGAAVEDTINGVDWVFFVNSAATFTQK